MAEYCPYIINIFKLSGKLNLMIFMACSSLKRLDYIVDEQFRSAEYINNVRMDLITGISKKLVLPIMFCIEEFDEFNEPCACCEDCKKNKKKK
jgi:hypothetical protein